MIIGDKHRATEATLERLGVAYHYEAKLKVGKINVTQSRRNNARIDAAIIEDVATQYGVDMLDGSPFPAIVVRKNGRGYLVVDGNNRIWGFMDAGFAKDGATIGAYVLDTDDELLIWIATRTLNDANGVPHTRVERLAHALATVEKFPQLTTQAVAKMFKIAPGAIWKAEKARDTESMLRSRRINVGRLSQQHLVELSRLDTSEPALEVAADVVLARKLTAAETHDLVKAVRLKRSDAAKIDAVNEIDKQYDRTKPKPRERANSPKPGFYRAMQSLLNFAVKYPSLEHLHITSKSEQAEAKLDWGRLSSAMRKIFS